ncbi:MAG: hypothetical protein JWO40_721 [Candidatus Doudnabacteria bacterium]|nr:hypothetical protein [Candidatus Doudnabacteria bacterium]
MNSLETQVGQIFISDKKLSKSFVCLLSEKVPETNAEIFSLVEIPILNPSAWSEYEKLAKLIQTILRKNFRKTNENAFENSIAQINDELAKFAAAGQTAWVGKINACLAVRQNDNLFISTTGKIHAYLFRDKQLSDIADSPTKINPLKTFENFAVGKVAKKDFLIFTTTQLLNYISIERLKDIISKADLGVACQSIAGIIKDLADQTVSFGTFILELGTPKENGVESVLKFTGLTEQKSSQKIISNLTPVIGTFYKKVLWKIKNFKKPQINLKDVNPMLIAERAKKMTDLNKIKALPKAKKFFLASAALFIIILLINLFVAIHVRSKHKLTDQANQVFADIQTKINQANSAYIYNDKTQAATLLAEAQAELTKIPSGTAFESQKNKTNSDIIDLQNSLGGLRTVQVTEVAKYSDNTVSNFKSAGGSMYLSNASGLFVPFKNGSLGQAFTLSNTSIAGINTTDSSLIFSDNNGQLFQVDPINKIGVKEAANLTLGKGLAFYGNTVKAYTVDTRSNQILNVTLNKNAQQTNYLKQSSDLSNVIDLAIDGSVYLLYPDRIKKFVSGNEKSFTNPSLKYSTKAKIYANSNWKYLYVLDPDAKKIIVLDKSGSVKAQYTSDKFTNLKDMVVDEAAKNIYLLNDTSILEFQSPI